jgi:hypothetical protein
MNCSDALKETEGSFLKANKADDLLKALAAVDISVPGRTKGRTTEHTERYSICHLLSTLAETDYLSYPLCLTKRERPDFLLNCSEQTIGIEITEATSHDYSSYQALIEHKKPGHFIESAIFRHGRTLSNERKKELLNAEKLISCGWAGDGAEREWSLFIKDAIEKKTKKLQEGSFSKFNQNWLVIYDNSPTSFLNEEDLIPYIKTLFPIGSAFSFDFIFIESSWFKEDSSVSEAKIFVLSNSDQKYLSVNNVWKRT